MKNIMIVIEMIIENLIEKHSEITLLNKTLSDIGNLNIENSKLKNKKIGDGENLIKIVTDTGDVTIK
ncbi:hypothetical protein [Staphylococcus xylosus]|uniref:hypothetical protein n=1 Tax=Staphylococcus xylosus TaxID=1288 RepID=UPI003F55B631